jgi:hypothetical protein
VLAASQPVNSRYEKMDAAVQTQARGFDLVGQAAVIGLIVVPLLLMVVAVVALRQAGSVKGSLKRLGVIIGGIVVAGVCLGGWFFALIQSGSYFDLEVLFIPLVFILGLGVLVFVGYAWIKRDPAAKFITLLTLAWPALLLLLYNASEQGAEPSEGWILAGLVAYLLIPGAYLVFGQTPWVQERRLAKVLVNGVGTLSALPAMLILPAVLLFSLAAGGGMGMRGAVPPGARQFAAPGEVWVGDVVLEAETMEMPVMEEAAANGDQSQAAGAEAPRLRQYFPETLYWNPEVLTDEGGFVSLEIPMADSITTWRLTALASSQDGRLGFTTRGVRVFQDFFVDVDLPVSLTQGDEISIPVGVFNYLPDAQEVRLVVEPESWFELLDPDLAEQTLTIASNDIEVVYFPIRVIKFGRRGFQVTAWGEQMSDAVRRQVNVVPDGKEFRFTESDWLREDEEFDVGIPPEAVPDTGYVEVKVYPGVMSQVIEGLEKILRLPNG